MFSSTQEGIKVKWDPVLPLTPHSLLFPSNKLLPRYELVYFSTILMAEIKNKFK